LINSVIANTRFIVREISLPHQVRPGGPGASEIYPNPTTGPFTLEINEHDLTQGLSAQICDLRGKKVLDINLNGQRKQVISLENQPKGMYFIRLFSNEKSETAKILKQ
jgi:hypothetical protein